MTIVYLSSVTVMELSYGAHKDASWRKANTEVLGLFSWISRLPLSMKAAGRIGGALRAVAGPKKRKPIGPLDTLIAAHETVMGRHPQLPTTREVSRVSGFCEKLV